MNIIYNENEVALIHLQPGRRTIRAMSQNYFVPFPWMYFQITYHETSFQLFNKTQKIFVFDECKVAFRQSQYSGENNDFLHTKMPNVYTDGRVCMDIKDNYFQDLNELIEDIVAIFFETYFTATNLVDLDHENYEIIMSFARWEELLDHEPLVQEIANYYCNQITMI